MSKQITRRKFLKLSGAGAAAAVVLTGCGPMSRYVTREPYYEMPEFSRVGESTYYATTCRECPAACGIIMRTMEGRAIKAEGNPAHPVSRGKICSRGLTSVQGLYNPDRVTGPVRRPARGEAATEDITWEDGVNVVAEALGNGAQTAFLLGLGPDHLFDFVTELADAIGAPEPLRYSVSGMLEGRSTLLAATLDQFGEATLPVFDIANADLVFSFGSDFLGTWVSPVSYGRAFGTFRRPTQEKRRGYLVSFEPRMCVTSGTADEWIPVVPGSEGLVAQAIAQLAGALGGEQVTRVDLETVINASGVSEEKLNHLAELWANSQSPLALVGGGALSHANGLETANAILGMNSDRLNQPGGMYIVPGPEAGAGAPSLPGVFNQVADLVERMNAGQVQTLFIHGVNPVFELPAALGFIEALANVPQVISFASFPDETALQSDYVLPDHSGLESFGYNKPQGGANVQVVSAVQPVVAPLYNTRATVDVLLAGAQQAGAGLNYTDEVDFIQQQLTPLIDVEGGSISEPQINLFWNSFLQAGGWWLEAPQSEGRTEGAGGGGEGRSPQQATTSPTPMVLAQEGQNFHLVTFATLLGDGSGANRPWLQETPDPMTTVTWNTWVEINPAVAEELGIHHDDLVLVRSSAGEIELPAYLYPAIRPDTIAIPFGQGHTALGRYAEGRGQNPMALIEVQTNDSGNLSFGDTLVTIEKTGRRRQLARLESIKGVYGEH